MIRTKTCIKPTLECVLFMSHMCLPLKKIPTIIHPKFVITSLRELHEKYPNGKKPTIGFQWKIDNALPHMTYLLSPKYIFFLLNNFSKLNFEITTLNVAISYGVI